MHSVLSVGAMSETPGCYCPPLSCWSLLVEASLGCGRCSLRRIVYDARCLAAHCSATLYSCTLYCHAFHTHPAAHCTACASQLERLLERSATSWAFDAWELHSASHGNPLSAMAYYAFHAQGLIDRFGIHGPTLVAFLRAVETGERSGLFRLNVQLDMCLYWVPVPHAFAARPLR